MAWASDFTFTVEQVSPWAKGGIAAQQPVEAPAYQSDENLKKQFGIELAKANNPFEAACKVFGEDTGKALWASANWMIDPIAIASRDAYLKTLELSSPALDREQLAAKVLALADETILKNGVVYRTIEAKDRIAAFKLYSEIMGYTGKVEIDNSTTKITHNEMVIKLVKADDKKPVTINQAPNVNGSKSEILNDQSSPISLKLVKAS